MMSRSSRGWHRLVELCNQVWRRNQIANARRFAYPPGMHRRSFEPVVENLEPRLLLSGGNPFDPLVETDHGIDVAIMATAEPPVGDAGVIGASLSGAVGDIIAIDLTDLVASDQYRLIGAQLAGGDWALDVQAHGADFRLVHNGDELARLISSESLGGDPFISTGRLYLAPALADGLSDDTEGPAFGFQGVLRLALEAGEPVSPVAIELEITIGAGASDSGPNVPLATGESAVLRAQQRLNYLADQYPALGLTAVELTGSPDVPTQTALSTFQAAVGLTADGVLGAQTADYLTSYPSDPSTLSADMMAASA